MSWLIPKIAYWTQPNFLALANSRGKIQLLTLGFSHYVELARWSLQLKGIKFDEHAYVPGQHILPVLAARVCGEAALLSDSSYVKPVGDRKKADEDPSKEAKRANSSRSTAVPLAIIPNSKEALADSWSIAKYSGLAAIDDDFKILLDTKLGPLSRQLAYAYILKQKSWFSELCSENQPWWWRMLWNLFVGGHVLKLLEKIFRPNDIDAVNKCRSDLKDVVSQCDDILKSRKGKFLAGDSLGVADIALCSLVAPMVMPDGYANGMYFKNFQKLMDMDENLRNEIEYWRKTETGIYTLKIYNDYRSMTPSV